MPRPGTPGGPMLPPPIFGDKETPTDFGGLIHRSPSKESCAECRSRQDPYVMHFADPCMRECGGGQSPFDFKLPDLESSPGSSTPTPVGALEVAADIFGNTPSESSQGAPMGPYGSRPTHVDTTRDKIKSLMRLALESFKEPELLI